MSDLAAWAREFEERFVVCPDRSDELPHEWASAAVDSRRPCRFCGRLGRGKRDESVPGDVDGNFEQATRARSEFFSRLRTPDSVRGIKPRDRPR